MSIKPRQPGGIPIGGQYATTGRPTGGFTLAPVLEDLTFYETLDVDHYLDLSDVRELVHEHQAVQREGDRLDPLDWDALLHGEVEDTVDEGLLAAAHAAALEDCRQEAEPVWARTVQVATARFNEGIPPESGEWVEDIRESDVPVAATVDAWDDALVDTAAEYTAVRDRARSAALAHYLGYLAGRRLGVEPVIPPEVANRAVDGYAPFDHRVLDDVARLARRGRAEPFPGLVTGTDPDGARILVLSAERLADTPDGVAPRYYTYRLDSEDQRTCLTIAFPREMTMLTEGQDCTDEQVALAYAQASRRWHRRGHLADQPTSRS